MIGIEPMVQQNAGGVRHALVSACLPRLHGLAQGRHARTCAELGGYVQQLGLRRRSSFSLLRGIAGLSHFTVISSVLVVSFPKMSITLTTTVYFPGAAYLYFVSSSILGSLRVAVGLPLIVKCVVLEVPIHSPIVNQLTPVFDSLSCFFRNVICRNNKVLQFETQLHVPLSLR